MDTDNSYPKGAKRELSPEYIARLKELEKYIPVMTGSEIDQLIYKERTDWPEDTLIKWSGKLAEFNARREELRQRVYARQRALRDEKKACTCK